MTHVLGLESQPEITYTLIEVPSNLWEPLERLFWSSKGVRPLLISKPFTGLLSVNQALIKYQGKRGSWVFLAVLDFPPKTSEIKPLSLSLYRSVRDVMRVKNRDVIDVEVVD